jgi:hypothetical protein
VNEPGLRDTIDAELADLLEKGGGDHFYGSWRGDGKGSGGRPVVKGGTITDSSSPKLARAFGAAQPHMPMTGPGKGSMFVSAKQEKAMATERKRSVKQRVESERRAMTNWLRQSGLTAEQHARYLGHAALTGMKHEQALMLAIAGG